jgi:hypothetical protein
LAEVAAESFNISKGIFNIAVARQGVKRRFEHITVMYRAFVQQVLMAPGGVCHELRVERAPIHQTLRPLLRVQAPKTGAFVL